MVTNLLKKNVKHFSVLDLI